MPLMLLLQPHVTKNIDKMKIYRVLFEAMWPVPSGLIICAETIAEAHRIAEDTVAHTHVEGVEEVNIDEPGVIFYESGNY